MEVVWLNDGEQSRSAAVLYISLQSLCFDGLDFNGKPPQQIRLIETGELFTLNKCRINYIKDNRILAHLEEFEDDITSQMHWVEILTRIKGDRGNQ